MSETSDRSAGHGRCGDVPGLGARHRAWRHRRLHARARSAAPLDASCSFAFRVGGAPAFGPGLYDLLRRFEATGSFAAAAAEMGVSYEAAWRALRFCERRLRLRLVRRRAGESVPGASLTPRGRTILERYAALSEQQAAILASLAARLERRA